MSTSVVSVVNMALTMIGADPIMSIDEDSTPAKKSKLLWDLTRDEVQRAHAWKCCLQRAELALMSDTPAFGYSYQYKLPTNPYCLRVLQMEEVSYIFTVEGRALLTDESTAKILYIKRAEDVASWDSMLKTAIAAKLAAYLAYPIAGSATLAETREKIYLAMLRDARSINAQEGTPPVYEVNEWINSRL